MKDHKDHRKQFRWTNKAWYGKGEKRPEIVFGFYSPEGGTSGEMSMCWYDLGKDDIPVPRLECFSDAWHALFILQDVLKRLADVDDEDIAPEQFMRILEQCGFVDTTPYRRK